MTFVAMPTAQLYKHRGAECRRGRGKQEPLPPCSLCLDWAEPEEATHEFAKCMHTRRVAQYRQRYSPYLRASISCQSRI